MNKRIIKDDLEVFLRKHKLWLANDPEGKRADLRGANLYRVDLRGVDLRGADLSGASLHRANLRGANLRESNLSGADLAGADLRGSNLYRANLHKANLCKADLYKAELYRTDLSGADLSETNLYKADLRAANLRETNLYEANIYGANLCGANLYRATSIPPIACPEKGSFTAFKKAGEHIVELLIPEDAIRCSATSRDCRCSKAKVVSITNLDGTKAHINSVRSNRYCSFIYTIGETVEVDDFNEDRWAECSAGIHFFITRQEAVDYKE